MIFQKKEGLPPHLKDQPKNIKKIIIISIAIIIILAIIIFASMNLFTGKTVISEGIASEATPKDPTTELTISPDPLTRGDYMTITMASGATGTDEIISISNEENQKVVENLNMNCNGPTCLNEKIIKIYKSSTAWKPGTYKVTAKDYATNPATPIEKTFTVVE